MCRSLARDQTHTRLMGGGEANSLYFVEAHISAPTISLETTKSHTLDQRRDLDDPNIFQNLQRRLLARLIRRIPLPQLHAHVS